MLNAYCERIDDLTQQAIEGDDQALGEIVNELLNLASEGVRSGLFEVDYAVDHVTHLLGACANREAVQRIILTGTKRYH